MQHTVQRSNRKLFPSKQTCVFVVIAAAFLLYFAGCASSGGKSRTAETPKTINVKDFGAKGDGIADDYGALQAAATAVCQSRGATLLFPAGTYRIDRYRITDGPKANTVQNIRYIGCRGTTITGVRAKIEVKGDFRRSADHIDGENIYSYETAVIPFEMINSSGFRISGFDLEGNVEKMTRDPKVVEGSASGILTTNCQDYFIQNVHVNGFATDGITLGENSQSADERAHLSNVTSTHNARLGLGIIQVRDAHIINSAFSQNGRTGRYGNHSSAGMAVTPVRVAPLENVSTGLINVYNCRFEENVGPQFYSGLPKRVDSITIRNSIIKSTLPDTGDIAFMSAPVVGVVSGNTFQIAAGHSVALAPSRPERYANIKSLIYHNNTFKLGDNKGITAPLVPAPVDLVGNKIIIDSRIADHNLLRLDYVRLVENNSFFEAKSGYSGEPYTILYGKGNTIVRNNRYETDRNTPGHFEVYYGQQVVASGDFFPHPSNFQPHYMNVAIQHQ